MNSILPYDFILWQFTVVAWSLVYTDFTDSVARHLLELVVKWKFCWSVLKAYCDFYMKTSNLSTIRFLASLFFAVYWLIECFKILNLPGSNWRAHCLFFQPVLSKFILLTTNNKLSRRYCLLKYIVMVYKCMTILFCIASKCWSTKVY